MTVSRTAFPSPYEMTSPAAAEGWERLYPYYMLFQPWRRSAEEERFWFRDSQHWPTVVKPFETVIPELAFKCLVSSTPGTSSYRPRTASCSASTRAMST